LKQGSVKAIQLENGPIRRELSIALLNGPDPKGPAGQLLEILREHGARKRYSMEKTRTSDEPGKVIVIGNVPTEEHQGAAS
jgi:hypothetical protein